MGKLFCIDGPLYKVCLLIYYCLLISFCWMIFSLGIITIGASTTSAYYVAGKIIRQEGRKDLLKLFIKAFLNNFKQATIVFCVYLVLLSVVINNALLMFNNGMVNNPIFYLNLIIIFELIVGSIYVYPIIARYKMSIEAIMKASILIGNRHIMTTLLVAVFTITVIFLTTQYIMPFILIFIGMIIMFSQYFLDKVLIKHESGYKEY